MTSAELDLVLAAQRGDRAAMTALLERHRERLLRFLTVMTGDVAAADDITQEALRQAVDGIAQLQRPERFANWLLSIAVNRCRNWLRDEVQRQHEGDAVLAGIPARTRSALSSIVRRESATQLALAIDRLPILLREAFVLFQVEGLPYAEIAELCGASENTLQVRVHRARGLLRRQLGAVVDTWWQRSR
ncbi:MAG: RNA polymerase sigma factor [Planctomycetes bacterium]|nr:RNA polymerase sigma factor [Planctomycetota bacterium]